MQQRVRRSDADLHAEFRWSHPGWRHRRGHRAAATVVITNINAAGVGFNDTTAATPVGGNPGTTLGQQRLNAFTYAFNLWGATLTSNVTINIQAQFSALSCTATSVTLGSAGATHIFRNFAGAPRTGYSSTTTRARRSIWWK